MASEKPRALRADERAVSPVLGVALLIAITVILAAVIAFVVLGFGPSGDGAPQAKLSFEESSGTLSMAHEGGDTLSSANTKVVVSKDSDTSITSSGFGSSDLTAGNARDIASTVNDGDVIRIVWEDPNSDRTIVLAKYTA